MSTIESINPSTGLAVETVTEETTTNRVGELAELAAAAAPTFEALGRGFRASLLRTIGDELESRRETIVTIGMRETALPENRLRGELTRTIYQARLFASLLDDGGYLEAAIDHADDTPMGPGPDLRRILVPVGPVAIFGASNFPLAFSVPGGDTVSALAAGCPAIIKAHSSHPALSLLTFQAMSAAATTQGAPEGLLGLVFGTAAGAALVAHPAITAVGFTGSLYGGRALMDIIAARPDPIPFYGELSSLNPIVVTPGAIASRSSEIATGLVDTLTGSAGQLCTKPGLMFVPHGPDGDALVTEAAQLVEQAAPATLLNSQISSSYEHTADNLAELDSVAVVAEGGRPTGEGFSVTPRLLQVDAAELQNAELTECFGPTAFIARYSPEGLDAAIAALPASLTGTIHAADGETGLIAHLSNQLKPKAGRLLYNGWPTGVLVSWAQHHGGPWPATNTLHSSVGTTSIRRWLRPVTWQNAPTTVLPVELHDDYTAIPRRVDGKLQLPA